MIALALPIVLAAMTLSLRPGVEEPRAPDAASVAAARDVLSQLTGENAQRGTRLTLAISQRELNGLAELGSEALSPLRMEARLVSQEPRGKTARTGGPAPPRDAALAVQMSRQLPLGAWINITGQARNAQVSQPAGLPDIDLTVGRLPIPQWLTHWAIHRLWGWAQGDVAQPLDLAQVLRRVSIKPAAITLTVVHPGQGAALAGLAQARGVSTDSDALAAAYCAIAGADDTDLAALVRRAGKLPMRKGIAQRDHNRALLAAIAMRAVPEYRDRLAGAAYPQIARCVVDAPPLTLAGRGDLAKHWALSAALTATLGSQVTRSMGTWKELADSMEGGSGFSFVDLAADRSGERFAIAAVDPKLARPVHIRLGAITQEQMLPRELLSKPEGLDVAAFERDYSATNSPEYARALGAINRLLGNAGVP
jgi:hypothetical protein